MSACHFDLIRKSKLRSASNVNQGLPAMEKLLWGPSEKVIEAGLATIT